jgi:hypothetical protein
MSPHGCVAGVLGRMWRLMFKNMDIQKIQKLKTAWGEFAQDNSYCNMTLAAATSAFQPVFDVRAEMATADLRYTALIAQRNTVDNAANDLMLRIVNAVKAEPDGENSPLYRAMGYVTKNERAMPGPRGSTTTNTASASANNSYSASNPYGVYDYVADTPTVGLSGRK